MPERTPVLQYFFPRGPLHRLMCRLGLRRDLVPAAMRTRLPDGSPRRSDARGPGGRHGLMVTWQPDVQVGYDPELQRWYRCGSHWLGIRRNYQPAEFARRHMVPGHPIALADGKLWEIPVAPGAAPDFDASGCTTLSSLCPVDPARRAVSLQAAALWRHRSGAGQLVIDEDELYRACALMIAVNYHLDADGIAALGLLSEVSRADIVRTVLGVPNPDTLGRALDAAELALVAATDHLESAP